jgi:methyl-accepting chemotaxis protein
MKKINLVQMIFLLAVTLFAIQVTSSAITFVRINIMGHHIENIEYAFIPVTKTLTLITEHQLAQEIEYERAFRHALEGDNTLNAMEKFQHSVDKYNNLTSQINSEIKTVLAIIQSSLVKAEEQALLDQLNRVKKDIKWIEQHHVDWLEHSSYALTLLNEGQLSDAIELSNGIDEESAVLAKRVADTLLYVEEFTEKAVHALKVEEESILNIGLVFLGISLFTAILATRFVTQNLTNDLKALKNVIDKIAKGDMKNKATSRLSTEFGIDQMRDNLRYTLQLVEKSSEEVMLASNELAKISNDVSQFTDQQAQEFELISTAMVEMDATSEEVARHAESTQSSTQEVMKKAVKGNETTDDAMNLIHRLTQSLEQSGQNIQELEKHSGQISSILDVIKGIAEQTNLLALNAAIEAARAGEQGRGFAVVADEVRGLAKRTQESTIEIESMVELFTRGISEAVTSMALCAQQGEASKKVTNDTNHSIKDIQAAVEVINDMNSQIATAAEQQSCTSKELANNTMKVSELTKSNVIAISQISVASEQLKGTSSQLREKLAQFDL